MWPSVDLFTDDGFDLQFGVNVLGSQILFLAFIKIDLLSCRAFLFN